MSLPRTRYRYELTRDFGERGWPMVFIMLNPSTADQELDDPTIRRCIGFAKREGAAQLHVVNLFGLRATKPKDLFAVAHDTAVGTFGNKAIRDYVNHAHRVGGLIVAAWGSNVKAKARIEEIRPMLRGREVFCLGTTQLGYPRHPLYVPADRPLVEYQIP
jgi:hypothetical protein